MPAPSTSIVICVSSVILVVDRTAAVAAVVDIVSLASIVRLVLKIDVPPLLMSIVTAPDYEAVFKLALGIW